MTIKTTHELVASRIPFGMTNEIQIICKVGNILRDMGKSNTQINFLLNVDEDFLSEVVSCYKAWFNETISQQGNPSPWVLNSYATYKVVTRNNMTAA